MKRQRLQMTRYSDVVARRVHQLRTARGWSRERLAEELDRRGYPGISGPTLLNIETRRINGRANGPRVVTVDELQAFSDVFGIAPADLLAALNCEDCADAPPPGYACLTCGKEATR